MNIAHLCIQVNLNHDVKYVGELQIVEVFCGQREQGVEYTGVF